mmetsp:Transcript_189/g.636  ORF Transcript_189/g.636 Transcript_189/m.636 type:complete len:326 (+) Transcript_189:261-1238(+)
MGTWSGCGESRPWGSRCPPAACPARTASWGTTWASPRWCGPRAGSSSSRARTTGRRACGTWKRCARCGCSRSTSRSSRAPRSGPRRTCSSRARPTSARAFGTCARRGACGSSRPTRRPSRTWTCSARGRRCSRAAGTGCSASGTCRRGGASPPLSRTAFSTPPSARLGTRPTASTCSPRRWTTTCACGYGTTNRPTRDAYGRSGATRTGGYRSGSGCSSVEAATPRWCAAPRTAGYLRGTWPRASSRPASRAITTRCLGCRRAPAAAALPRAEVPGTRGAWCCGEWSRSGDRRRPREAPGSTSTGTRCPGRARPDRLQGRCRRNL